MGQRVTIEKWAENLEEATVALWLKSEGDQISAGGVLCEIITDKATFEYTVEAGGVVARIYAAERSVLPVGYVAAYISAAGEQPDPDIEAHNEALLARHQQRTELDLGDVLGSTGAKSSRLRATPVARRLARQHSVELQRVADWLGDEAELITEEHVEAYLAAKERGGHD